MIDDAALRNIESSISTVEQLAARMLGQPSAERVQAGSPLEIEDQELPGEPIRSAAWFGIITAVDHLNAASAFARGHAIMGPFASFTILRSALLGSAQTVWMLGVPTEERRRRALIVAIEDCQQHLAYLEFYDRKVVKAGMTTKEQAEVIKRRVAVKADLKALNKAFGEGQEAPKLSATTMISNVAAEAPANHPSDRNRLKASLARDWQRAGAAVHGRSWQIHERPTILTPMPGGRATRELSMSHVEFASAFNTATDMTVRAVQLWDELRVASAA